MIYVTYFHLFRNVSHNFDFLSFSSIKLWNCVHFKAQNVLMQSSDMRKQTKPLHYFTFWRKLIQYKVGSENKTQTVKNCLYFKTAQNATIIKYTIGAKTCY
jgi:hypothetical protein